MVGAADADAGAKEEGIDEDQWLRGKGGPSRCSWGKSQQVERKVMACGDCDGTVMMMVEEIKMLDVGGVAAQQEFKMGNTVV